MHVLYIYTGLKSTYIWNKLDRKGLVFFIYVKQII